MWQGWFAKEETLWLDDDVNLCHKVILQLKVILKKTFMQKSMQFVPHFPFLIVGALTIIATQELITISLFTFPISAYVRANEGFYYLLPFAVILCG